MQKIPPLYEEHKDSLQGAKAFIYASTNVNSGAYVADKLAEQAEAMIRDELKFEPTIVKYTEEEIVIKGPDYDFDLDNLPDDWDKTLMHETIIVRSKGDGKLVVEFVHN